MSASKNKNDKGKPAEKKAPSEKKPPEPPKKTLSDYNGRKVGLSDEQIQQIPLANLDFANTDFQIRVTTKPEFLKDSISTHGILDPLIVRKSPDKEDSYQIVSGFNRAEAAKLAGLEAVPVIVKELSDKEAFIYTFLENHNRKTISDLDRAYAIQKLRDVSEEGEAADPRILFGIGDRQVENLLGILKYPEELKTAIDDTDSGVTTTHAMVLNQAKNKLKKEFDLDHWIKRVKEEKPSVIALKKEIRADRINKTPKRSLMRFREGTVTFCPQHLDKADESAKQKARKELEKLLKQFGG